MRSEDHGRGSARNGSGLRVGHAEREGTISQLQEAMAEGRLTMRELEERVEAATEARFQAELDELVADLPQAAVGRALVQHGQNGLATSMPATIEAGWNTVVRAGRWHVPSALLIKPRYAAVVLNLLQAVPPADGVIDITLRGGWGSFVVILPPGWGVDAEPLRATMTAWATMDVDAPLEPEPGKPLIVVRGEAKYGRVSIRPEAFWDQFLHSSNRA